MPFYYDINGAKTSNASGGTETTHFWSKTSASQESVALKGVFAASRIGTAGGGIARVKSNTGTTASGGTSQTAAARNLRSPAASSTWSNETAGPITAGVTLTQRISIGFAQTGGQGGWVPLEAPDAVTMMPNATNPVDLEFTSVCSAASVTFDLTLEFSEGY